MSEQETMRLVAEVVDKYSGPLKQMLEALKKIGEGSKDVHEKGAKQTNQHEKAYRDLREQLNKVKDTTTDVLRPAFMALGVTVLSVAGSIAAISEATRKFGDYGQKLEYAHRASGLLTQTIRGLSEANEAYGGTTDDTVKSLQNFGEHMKELGRFAPEYLNQWKKFVLKDSNQTLFDALGKDLMSGSVEDKLRKAMDFLPHVRDVDQRKRIVQLLGLPENYAYLTEKEFADMRKRAAEINQRFPWDPEKAAEAKKAWEDFFTSMRGYQSQIAQSSLGQSLVDALKGMEDLLKSSEFKGLIDELRQDADVIGKTFGEWKVSDSLKEDLNIIHGTLKLIRETIEWIQKNWHLAKPDEAKKSIQDKFGAFGLGSSLSTKDQKEAVKQGTKEGMLDFWNLLKGMTNDGGAQYIPTAFHPGGGFGGPGGGAPGSTPRTFRFGNREYPSIGSPGGGAPSVDKNPDGSNDIGDVPTAPNGTLAQQRAPFAEQLKNNPALLDKVLRIGANEQGINPQGTEAIFNELFNRTIVRGHSLESEARWHESEGGYYQQGNMGRGFVDNPRRRAILMDSLRRSLAGSNIDKYSIDNSSGWLANKHMFQDHRFKDTAVINGEHMEIPWQGESETGDRAKYWAWRKRTEESEAAAAAHGTHLRDFIARGHGAHRDAEALRRVLRGADAGDSMRGSAHLTVDLNGLPRGTRTNLKTGGQLFKQVTLNRGRPMNSASES